MAGRRGTPSVMVTSEYKYDDGYRKDVTRPRPPRNGGVPNVVRQMRAERLRLGLMRLAFATLALAFVLTLVWVLPWFPIGLTFDNYSGPAAGAVVLCALTCLGALGFTLVWGPSFRNEPLPEFLRVLFGGHQLIRGRHQFYSRLAAECRRAKKDRRYVFSIVILQRGPGYEQHDWLEPSREADVAAVLVRSVVRSDDVVATSPGAIFVLVTGAADQARERVVGRLAKVFLAFDEPLGLYDARAIGSATFGEDGDSPELLLFAMKERMRRLVDFEDGQAPVPAGESRF